MALLSYLSFMVTIAAIERIHSANKRYVLQSRKHTVGAKGSGVPTYPFIAIEDD